MTDRFDEAQAIFRKHAGILRSGDAQTMGIDPNTLLEMVDAEILEKLGRGLYRLADLPPLEHPDLVQVTLRVPKAVVCLISALAFHDLTTQIPHRVYIALPQSVKRPRITYPPLQVSWLSGDAYEAGIENHLLDHVRVPIYDAAKTVSDCFKFRNKIGKDIALESLKEYLRQPYPNIDLLLHYARINRVENVVRPYLEVLV